MSEVLQTAQQGYVVIMKEYDHPAQNVNFEDKKELIRQSAMEKKRQTEVPKIIAEIKSQASTRIKMYLDTTSDPARRGEVQRCLREGQQALVYSLSISEVAEN